MPGLVLQVFGHIPIALSSNATRHSSCSLSASLGRYFAPDSAEAVEGYALLFAVTYDRSLKLTGTYDSWSQQR